MAEGNEAVKSIEQTPVSIQWTKILELGYEITASKTILPTSPPPPPKTSVCFRCLKPNETLKKCAGCGTASYCSRDCQVQDWKALSKGGGGHKGACPAYKRLVLKEGQVHVDSPENQQVVRNEIFARIRIYACSYAVHRTGTLGRGFLFLQSDSTLATLSTPFPKDGFGLPVKQIRAILVHFLTLPEYDGEVCRDDFEMMQVRSQLQQAVADYDMEAEVVVLMRFRCGHVALGTAKLVPDYNICKVLGQQYFADHTSKALQLNLDDI